MNQAYVYEEDELEEGITFKKVGYFFKKGWLRMLIYVVVLALLTTAIAVPIKVLYKSEPIAQTSVEYIYDGIEDGLDPNGNALNTDNIISMQVLQSAVQAAKLENVIKDITTLRNSMRVEGVATDEYVQLVQAAADGDADAANTLRGYTMHPTRFDIIISDPSELGLSDDQAKLLLNKIVAAYYADFQNRFYSVKPFSTELYTLSSDGAREFTDIYDKYVAELGLIKATLDELGAQSANSATKFAPLLVEYNILYGDYASFDAYLLSNNVWRNIGTARDNLIEKQTQLTHDKDALQEDIANLKDQISKIQPNTTTTGSGDSPTIVQTYPEYYYVLQANLYAKNETLSDYQVQLKNIETRLGKLDGAQETSPERLSEAKDKLEALEAQTVQFVEKANSAVEEYYGAVTASKFKQVQPPEVTRRMNDLNLWIIYLIVVIAGILVAGVVTCVKIAKAKAAAKKPIADSAVESDGGAKNNSEKE